MMTDEKVLREYVTDLIHCQDQAGLTDWEKDFVADMDQMRSLSSLSYKQKQKILDLADKYL